MLFVRSCLFYAGLGVSTLIFSPLSILIFPMPFLWRYRFISGWTSFNLWWLKITCGIAYQVEYPENIPKQTAIVMCKHQSAWETLSLQQIFPPHVFVIKRELLWFPLFGWALATLEPIAIDRAARGRALKQIIQQGTERLHAGRWVIIFPEGTRVASGKRGPYLPGGGLLAEKTGYPVVPVAHNAGAFWPRKRLIKRPGTIRVVIGPVIESRGKTADEIRRQAEDWIEHTMQSLTAHTALS
ncbi:MAG: 1-acyl-sn-glycerol-3-phosphate acyltransferase [Gammaproteobacteria bacterium]|nr:1-acyl-sn-glycerol-3-phosphate acyltransferase [Gammaproteobacteria bacterium]MCI0590831.1 1-acyl-sn-glycerol-3-phosphate acyltransferase [Gammaproteobacteria bacterium]